MMSNHKTWNICPNIKSTELKFGGVDVLQELHLRDCGYDVTKGTYTLTDIYPPKMKNDCFSLQRLTDFLVLVLRK